MKLNMLVLASAMAQGPEGRALSLDARIGNAQEKCRFFMDKAFYCEPPKGKKSKYVFRLNKIMFDSVHHVSVGKCADKSVNNYNSYRRKRDIDELEEEFAQIREEMNAEDEEFSGKGYSGVRPPKPATLDRLENICRKYMATVWNAEEVKNCPKLGSWERRSKGLLNDLTVMKNVCKNQSQDSSSYSSNKNDPYKPKPTNKPTTKPYNPKPTNKPTTKPYKPTKAPGYNKKTTKAPSYNKKPTKKPKY